MDKESIVEAVLIAQETIKESKERNGVIETTIEELKVFQQEVANSVIDELRANDLLKEEI